MSPSVSRGDPSPRACSWLVVSMLGMIVVPAAITLHTVRTPGILQIPSSNPSPHGYTWSLLLFIVPILVIAFWFVPREGVEIPRRAFWRTLGILVPLGCGLDFFFAHCFFCFPNPGATLRIGAPAIGGAVPIEEYVFYLTGFMAVLLLYIWLSEFWLAAYGVADYRSEAKKIPRLLQFHAFSAILAVVLIVAAIAYKKVFSSFPDGFPGYFTLLVAGALVPAASFFPAARPFINWRAFSLTLFIIVLISLLWEATLAVPYGWWNFQPRQMVGLFVGAWSDLPIEEVGVWIAVTYATTIVFEVIKLWQASERPARHAFLGSR
jgi:lycopene cyclase domain-containing protein